MTCKNVFFFFTLSPHARNNSCTVGAFTNIEKSHTQSARPGTTICRPYKYCSVRGSNPRHAAHQSIAPPSRHSCRACRFILKCYLGLFSSSASPFDVTRASQGTCIYRYMTFYSVRPKHNFQPKPKLNLRPCS